MVSPGLLPYLRDLIKFMHAMSYSGGVEVKNPPRSNPPMGGSGQMLKLSVSSIAAYLDPLPGCYQT